MYTYTNYTIFFIYILVKFYQFQSHMYSIKCIENVLHLFTLSRKHTNRIYVKQKYDKKKKNTKQIKHQTFCSE